LKTKVPNVVVVDRDNASRSDYTQTILVDALGGHEAEAKALAKTLGISYAPLPAGESPKPEDISLSASFIIILGTDKK
jgi:hypothetical protein